MRTQNIARGRSSKKQQDFFSTKKIFIDIFKGFVFVFLKLRFVLRERFKLLSKIHKKYIVGMKERHFVRNR